VNLNTEKAPPTWTFLTNHSHVLVCLIRFPNLTVREIAPRIGITERNVIRIINDLEAAGVIQRERNGRRNSYRVNLDTPLRHPMESGHTVHELLDFIAPQNSET
jgi:predicted transcriptional regulator